jgi:uncharacterized protein
MMQVREGALGFSAAWTRVRGDLPDVNVWLALAQPKHPHHELAKNYWQTTSARFAQEASEQAGELIESKIHFCRTTMLGLVRVLSQTSKLYGQAMSLKESFSLYQRYMLLPEIGFVTESADRLDATLSALHQAWPQMPTRLSTDVYLVALASVFQLRIVTFDHDFKRFEMPDLLILGEA